MKFIRNSALLTAVAIFSAMALTAHAQSVQEDSRAKPAFLDVYVSATEGNDSWSGRAADAELQDSGLRGNRWSVCDLYSSSGARSGDSGSAARRRLLLARISMLKFASGTYYLIQSRGRHQELPGGPSACDAYGGGLRLTNNRNCPENCLAKNAGELAAEFVFWAGQIPAAIPELHGRLHCPPPPPQISRIYSTTECDGYGRASPLRQHRRVMLIWEPISES